MAKDPMVRDDVAKDDAATGQVSHDAAQEKSGPDALKADAAKPGSRRAPPTIDLSRTEFKSASEPAKESARDSAEDAAKDDAAIKDTTAEEAAPAAAKPSRLIDHAAAPYLAAILCGLLAAGTAVALVWGSGRLGQTSATQQRLDEVQQRTADLSTQVSRVEAATKAGGAPAAAVTARIDALEKTIAALRDDAAATRRQTEAISTTLKNTPASAAAAIDPQLLERIARLEGAMKTTSAAVAAEPAANAGLQRLMIATALDAAVRRGEPFAAALSAAKKAGSNAAQLTALDGFADKGVPTDAAALRDLRDLLAQSRAAAAAPATPTPAAASSGVLDRLQASLAHAVKIERETTATAPVASPALEAALRSNDLAAARRELTASVEANQPPLRNWLQLMQARDAALTALRQFQADALTAATASAQ